MARFNMGSTVILLFPPGAAEWTATLRAGQTLRMGERIGTLARLDPHGPGELKPGTGGRPRASRRCGGARRRCATTREFFRARATCSKWKRRRW